MFLKTWSRYDTISSAVITAGILVVDYFFNPHGICRAVGILLG